MKRGLLITLCCFFILTSCTVKNDQEINPVKTKYLWHLIQVNGGIAGINDEFELETIIWTFNEGTLKLTIENKNLDDGKQDGFDSGTYDYTLKTVDNDAYLIVNDNELGKATFTQEQDGLTINENLKTSGNGADGFIYTFKRTVVVVE